MTEPGVAVADIAVVGAGPAGAAAAITAARAGRDVLLLDKARFPRDKSCGDGLTTGALRLLEQLGFDPSPLPAWQVVTDAAVCSPSGRRVILPLPAGEGQFAAVAPRRDLDAALVDVARRAGVEVADGCACKEARLEPDRVVLDVEGLGEVHARYVVGADGVWSRLRKMLGVHVPGYRGEWHAFRQYYVDVGPHASRYLWVWFEPDLLPGYLWSFPLPGGRANVGFGIRRGSTMRVGEMGRLWPELLDRPHVRDVLGPNARPESPHRAWPIPARVDTVPLTRGRVLFAGDAAAATDPMTGEGIAQALLTGMLAAEALSAAGPFAPAQAASRYEAAVRRELFSDHRLARWLGQVLGSERGARGAVRAAGLTAWSRRNFARWLFEDYPRAAIATPRRWRRNMFSRPGAFRD